MLGKQAGPFKYTDEQAAWLRMVRDFIANSFHLDREIFSLSPFAGQGGLGKAWQLFGEQTSGLIDELNEALSA